MAENENETFDEAKARISANPNVKVISDGRMWEVGENTWILIVLFEGTRKLEVFYCVEQQTADDLDDKEETDD